MRVKQQLFKNYFEDSLYTFASNTLFGAITKWRNIMVRRKTGKKTGRRVSRVAVRGYKKCIVSGMKMTKFKTAASARKAFARVTKKCKAKLCVKPGRKVASKRHCKYGRKKTGRKGCLKHKRARR